MNTANSRVETKKRKRVLVADDEDDFLSIMHFFLTLKGFEVETATNGEEAVQAVKRERPDLILLDVVMPIMDGYSALREIRQKSDTKDIPVIMLSILEAGKEQLRNLNITDYLVKPFSTERLFQKISETLSV
jgi:twitching motility two-component system response regulator PilH